MDDNGAQLLRPLRFIIQGQYKKRLEVRGGLPAQPIDAIHALKRSVSKAECLKRTGLRRYGQEAEKQPMVLTAQEPGLPHRVYRSIGRAQNPI